MTKLVATATLLTLALLAVAPDLQAQDQDTRLKSKVPIYGNINIGYGNTFFRGRLREKEERNDQRGYGRNQGNTAAVFFYAAPEKWKGLGVGAGVKGFFATPNNGGDDETYFFNYYHVGVGAKYYLLSRTFNKGLFLKSSAGFGQMTEKTRFNATRVYEHQFAIGTTVLGGFGYSFPVGKGHTALNVDFDYENSSRRGDVTGLGEDQTFQNSHVSLNVGVTF